MHIKSLGKSMHGKTLKFISIYNGRNQLHENEAEFYLR